jgi:hypothetical protein
MLVADSDKIAGYMQADDPREPIETPIERPSSITPTEAKRRSVYRRWLDGIPFWPRWKKRMVLVIGYSLLASFFLMSFVQWMHFNDWTERQSHNIALPIVAIQQTLLWAFIVATIILGARRNPDWRKHKFLWLYILIGVSVIVGGGDLRDLIFVPSNATGTQILKHPNRSAIIFQVDLVIFLIGIGALLYLFKHRNKLAYGISELLIGVISNLILFAHLNPANFRQLTISFDDAVKLCLFTYIISRGFGNVAEGVAERRAKSVATAPLSNTAAQNPV